MVAPASGFYATPGLGSNEVRIAYVLKEEDLKTSIRILRAALDAHGARRAARSGGAVEAVAAAGPDFGTPAGS